MSTNISGLTVVLAHDQPVANAGSDLQIKRGEVFAVFSERRGYVHTWPNVELAYVLETPQLLNATIHCGEIWSPTQQCGGVSETPADVDIGKNYLTDHFGRHPPPLGDQ